MSFPVETIGAVCDVIAGQSPEGKNYNKEGVGLPFYQGKKDFGDVYINPPSVWTTQVTKEAIEGDILMSVRAPVGPVNIATENICIGRGLAAIRASSRINKLYLFYYLLKIEKELIGNSGAVFNSINKTQIESISIPLPPLSTQQKIVERLDAIFAEIDKATAAAEANIKNAEALFQGYLTDIFERGDRDWSIYKFDDIVENKQVGLVKNSYEQIQNGEYSYFKMNNISNNNQCDLRMLARVNVTEEELNKYRLIKNDFLFNTRNSKELVGKVCVFHGEESDNIIYNNNIMRIRFKSFVDPDFIHQAFSYKKTRLQLDRLKTGATNVAAIYYKDLKTLSLPIPNIDKQANVIDSLKNLHIQIDALIKTNKSKIELLSSLRQSIFIRAFNGELIG